MKGHTQFILLQHIAEDSKYSFIYISWQLDDWCPTLASCSKWGFWLSVLTFELNNYFCVNAHFFWMNFKELFTDLYFEYSTLSPSTPFIDRTANIFIHAVCKVLFNLKCAHLLARCTHRREDTCILHSLTIYTTLCVTNSTADVVGG